VRLSPEIAYEPSTHRALPVEPPAFDAYFTRVEHCTSDAFNPAWDKQYERTGIGAVISGGFDYRAQSGAATGVPGTIVFGNLGEQFRVQYLSSQYVQRFVVWYENEFLEKVADALGLGEARFPVAVLPPGKAALSFFAKMKTLANGGGESEDAAYALAVAALTIGDDHKVSKVISSRDRERILSAVSYIECSFGESCSVDALANISNYSRYHFMRLFKAVTGQSANQYLINTRLRAAVARIAETKAPLSEIALDVGFNDISHFNTCFRAMFDCTPRQMRKLVRAA